MAGPCWLLAEPLLPRDCTAAEPWTGVGSGMCSYRRLKACTRWDTAVRSLRLKRLGSLAARLRVSAGSFVAARRAYATAAFISAAVVSLCSRNRNHTKVRDAGHNRGCVWVCLWMLETHARVPRSLCDGNAWSAHRGAHRTAAAPVLPG